MKNFLLLIALLSLLPLSFGYVPSNDKDIEADSIGVLNSTYVTLRDSLDVDSNDILNVGDFNITGQFVAVSTTKGNRPCPVMTETERDAIASPSEGDCIVNSTENELNFYLNSLWGKVGGSSTPTTTEGDLIIRGAVEDERLALGTSGQLLTSNGTTASWQDAPISTTLDTKGQLQGFSTVNANVGPCFTSEFLVYDTDESTGWKCSDQLQGVLNPITDTSTEKTLSISATTSAPTKGTVSVDSSFYSLIGDKMHITYDYAQTSAGGANGSGTYLFEIPDGYIIDTTKVNTTGGNLGRGSLGEATIRIGTTEYTGYVSAYDSTNLKLVVGNETTAPNNFNSTMSGFTDSLNMGFSAIVPIQGLSSGTNAVVRNEKLLKVKAARGSVQTIPTATNETVIYNLEREDNYDAYDSSTGIFTSPRPDGTDFKVCAALFSASVSFPVTSYWQLQVILSGTSDDKYLERTSSNNTTARPLFAQGCEVYTMDQGDTLSISIRHTNGSNVNTSTDAKFNYLSITEQPSSSVITGTFGKCQQKYLTADISSNVTNISDLEITNMEIGQRYKVCSQVERLLGTNELFTTVRAVHDGTTLFDNADGHVAASQITRDMRTCSPVFTATATSVTFDTLSINSTDVRGNGTDSETWVEICTSNKEATTEF